MPSQVNLSYGNVSFSAEGENEDWISEQLDKILKAAETLSRHVSSSKAKPEPLTTVGSFSATLASHLKAKSAESNQVKRFLVTADWLRSRGSEKLNTTMVSKALSDNQQKRLGNPADSLNKNVSKGHCEKVGDDFFITPDGLKSLGYD